ncbi:MAG: thioredoxin family protein [Pseudomonadota bacterium]|nr:thioredoxin family protein [Pseudomonadota bacterium]
MSISRRRAVGFLGLIGIAGSTVAADDQASKPTVTLIYFGASNCPTCRNWKRFDLPKLKETEPFKAARFVEIQKEIPAPIPGADKFPPELAASRDAISESFKGKVGSPMFAIVVGDRVSWSYRGAPSNEQVVDALLAAMKS